MLMLVWFNSSAFVAYMKFFHMGHFFHIEEYEESLTVTPDLYSYPEYLGSAHSDNLLCQIVSCPTCLCVWLSLAFSVVFGPWWLFLAQSIVSLSLYHLSRKLMKN